MEPFWSAGWQCPAGAEFFLELMEFFAAKCLSIMDFMFSISDCQVGASSRILKSPE